ncbi:MAG: mechanosensitive ion channel, partial [Deltaproteobacteria bacterium]|nr:mechanosensitive ion channel [Deltaproteobacteria bacterium]
MGEIFKAVRNFLDIPLFRLGSGEFTLWTLLYLILFTILLIYLAGRLNHWIAERLLSQSRLHLGVRQAVGSLIRYVIIAIGVVIMLQTAGIDLTTLNVIAGAVGIGVGFGLQDIASNFISGLVILFERPIKIGDRIEVGGVEGDVTRIGARSTSVLTND